MRSMHSALNNNQSIRIEFTLSRAYVLILTRNIREKLVQNLTSQDLTDKTEIVVSHDVLNKSIADIEVIITDHQYRI